MSATITETAMPEIATAVTAHETNGTASTTAPKAKAKPEKKAKPKAKAKPEKKATTETSIRKPQLRVLAALAKSRNGSLPVSMIAEKANIPATHVSGYVFLATKAKKAAGVVALAEMGLVREVIVDIDGGKDRCAEITAKGRKAIAK